MYLFWEVLTMVTESRLSLPRIPMSTRLLKSGAGAPVLLLHGSPDTATEWRRVMEALGNDCACYAPDLPGLGASDPPPPSFDYSRAAAEAFLDEIVESLGLLEPIVVVVHDIGGVFGVPWARRRLEKIRGVVITNTVVFERFAWFGPAKIWAQSGPAGRRLAELMMWQTGLFGGRIFRRFFGRISPELPQADLDRMVREFACDPKSKQSTLRLFRQMVPHAYFEGVEQMLRELIAAVPTRVVWGRGDPYIPPKYADAFSGAKLEIVENGGHWIPISAAERVAAAVREVLAGGDGKARTA
jgi:haloalkane dehalogenase